MIKKLNKDQHEQAVDLIWDTFMKYDAPDYTREGMEEFCCSIHDPDFLESMEIFGFFEEGKLKGVLASRNFRSHIALLFAEKHSLHHEVGTTLVQWLIHHSLSHKITVNSSPYARDFYRHLGFEQTGVDEELNGIRYIPMTYLKRG